MIPESFLKINQKGVFMTESELRKKAVEILRQRSIPMSFEDFRKKPMVEHMNNYHRELEKIISELKGK